MTISTQRQELLEKLETNRKHLLEIVSQIPERQLTRPQKPGDRSPKGQLLHLSETEWSYVERWARRARDEDAPDVSAPAREDPSRAALYDEANDIPLSELLERLQKARQNTIKFLEETSDEQFPRVARNTPFGNMTVAQFLRSLYRHDEMHFDEILGKESRYVVTTSDGRRL
jgi:hypothetical protein